MIGNQKAFGRNFYFGKLSITLESSLGIAEKLTLGLISPSVTEFLHEETRQLKPITLYVTNPRLSRLLEASRSDTAKFFVSGLSVSISSMAPKALKSLDSGIDAWIKFDPTVFGHLPDTMEDLNELSPIWLFVVDVDEEMIGPKAARILEELEALRAQVLSEGERVSLPNSIGHLVAVPGVTSDPVLRENLLRIGVVLTLVSVIFLLVVADALFSFTSDQFIVRSGELVIRIAFGATRPRALWAFLNPRFVQLYGGMAATFLILFVCSLAAFSLPQANALQQFYKSNLSFQLAAVPCVFLLLLSASTLCPSLFRLRPNRMGVLLAKSTRRFSANPKSAWSWMLRTEILVLAAVVGCVFALVISELAFKEHGFKAKHVYLLSPDQLMIEASLADSNNNRIAQTLHSHCPDLEIGTSNGDPLSSASNLVWIASIGDEFLKSPVSAATNIIGARFFEVYSADFLAGGASGKEGETWAVISESVARRFSKEYKQLVGLSINSSPLPSDSLMFPPITIKGVVKDFDVAGDGDSSADLWLWKGNRAIDGPQLWISVRSPDDCVSSLGASLQNTLRYTVTEAAQRVYERRETVITIGTGILLCCGLLFLAALTALHMAFRADLQHRSIELLVSRTFGANSVALAWAMIEKPLRSGIYSAAICLLTVTILITSGWLSLPEGRTQIIVTGVVIGTLLYFTALLAVLVGNATGYIRSLQFR